MSRSSNRSMDHATRPGSGNNSNSMRFFVSRHLVPPPPPPPLASSTSRPAPILDSLIWTTSGSSPSTTTNGISSSSSSNNNNNNSSPSSSSSSNNAMLSQLMNNSTSSPSSSSTAQPVINGSSKTRIDYHSMFPTSTGNGNRGNSKTTGRQGFGTSTGTQAGGQMLQAPRDRKPLSPEYEIPSVSSRASSSCGPLFSDAHHRGLTQSQQKQLQSHLHNKQQGDDFKCVNSSYNVNYGLKDNNDPDRDLLGDEIIGHQSIGQPLNVVTNGDGSRVTDLMMATPPETNRSGSDLSRLSPSSSNSMNNHDNVIMIGSDHESSPEHHHDCNQSESHIYSHIYDPSSCSCLSCDRLTNTSSRTKIMYPTTSNHHTTRNNGQLCHDLTSTSSVLRTGFGMGGLNGRQPVLTLPSYHDKFGNNKKKSKKSNNQTQHNISLATLHKLNNLKSSSPDFLSHHPPPPPYLQGLDSHLRLDPYSTTYNLPSISPIVIEYEKDRRKKCLVLSAALALLVLLILLLVTSFVVFIISSYRSYYSANAVAATFTGTSTLLPPHLDPTSSSPFYERHPAINNNSFDERSLIPSHQPSDPSTTEPAQISSTMAFNEPPPPSPVSVDSPPVILSHYDEEEEQNCREGEEWKCRDGLCVPKDKRCDGHFNCFDHSDEFDCDPCPTFDGYFHCGNNTACLHPSKKCDGVYNCWDGADEHGCDSYVHDGYST